MYITTSVFLWQHAKPPRTYATRSSTIFTNTFMPSLYQKLDSAVANWNGRPPSFGQFFLGPALSIPFLHSMAAR